MLTEIRKSQIAEKIRQTVSEVGSYDKAVIFLNRVVSKATLNNMANRKWELIKDELWNLTAAKLGLRPDWQTADTGVYVDMCNFMKSSQLYQSNFWVLAPAGAGKTEAIGRYKEENQNVFVVRCRDYSRLELVRRIATSLSIDPAGRRYRELEEEVINKLQSSENPLLVFDEADKLKDDALRYLIVLENELPNTGFFCCSTPAMRKRMNQLLKRIGGEELFSRFGRRFIEIDPPCDYDVELICKANCVTDKSVIGRIKKSAKSFSYDMRIVVALIKKEWMKKFINN